MVISMKTQKYQRLSLRKNFRLHNKNEETFSKNCQDHLERINERFEHEIERRREVEGELRNMEERIDAIWNNEGSGIIIVDARTYEIVDVNSLALEMIGTKRNEILGETLHKYIVCRSEVTCPIPNRGMKVKNLKRILIDNKGREIPILNSVTSVIINGNEHYVESFSEITEADEAEKELAFLVSITENSEDAIISLDMEGVFTSWNKGAEEMLGFRKDEIIGKSFGYIVPDHQKHTCVDFLLTADENGCLKGAETVRRAKDGREVPVEINLATITNSKGEQIGYSYIIKDITKIKLFEEKISNKQKSIA